MKSVPFDYVRPKTLESACSYLSKDPNSLVLAGGQSLLPMLSMRLARPSILVDIAHIKELQIIENKRETIKIEELKEIKKHTKIARSNHHYLGFLKKHI